METASFEAVKAGSHGFEEGQRSAAMETASFEAVKDSDSDSTRSLRHAAMETASFEAVKLAKVQLARLGLRCRNGDRFFRSGEGALSEGIVKASVDQTPQWRPLLSKR